MSRRANPTFCQKKKKKKVEKNPKALLSNRNNFLSLVNSYVVYQERKTKHALKGSQTDTWQR